MTCARHRAFSLPDLVVALAAGALLLAIVLPVTARTKGDAGVQTSLSNLAFLGAAHAIYALDWDDRQPMLTVDGLASYGSSAPVALAAYNAAHDPDHPPVTMGWGEIVPSGLPTRSSTRRATPSRTRWWSPRSTARGSS
jgi:hypothetical protein